MEGAPIIGGKARGGPVKSVRRYRKVADVSRQYREKTGSVREGWERSAGL